MPANDNEPAELRGQAVRLGVVVPLPAITARGSELIGMGERVRTGVVADTLGTALRLLTRQSVRVVGVWSEEAEVRGRRGRMTKYHRRMGATGPACWRSGEW